MKKQRTESENEFKKAPKNHNKSIIILLVILLVLISIADLFAGSVYIAPGEIIKSLINHDTSTVAGLLLFNVRLPRMFAALFAGMGLACAGIILQSVMNNALASPNTIGVNSGAGFAVMLCLMITGGQTTYTSLFAFAGSLITTLFIYLLAYMSDSSRTTIILAGITVSSFLSSGINTIKLLDSDITINITTFLIGSLAGVTWKSIMIPGIAITISVIISMLFSTHLNILSFGDATARSLGLNVNVSRFMFLTLSSIMAGCVVSFAGLLGFVGLIVPHIARKLFGNDARITMPCSALLGGIFVILCDLTARIVAAPYELPAGIIMSFIGGPFFMYLLLKKKGGRRVNA
ncbi:MAG: FecCD family ABC transporter permease [Lachnospira sp.]